MAIRRAKKRSVGLREKEEDWTTPTQVGDSKGISVRKAYAKKIGKAGRKKLVKDIRKRAIGREVSKAMPMVKGLGDKLVDKDHLYGDWLGKALVKKKE